MSRISYGRGSMSVVVDDQTADLVRRAIERVAPGMVARLEQVTEELYQSAHQRWPVGPDKPERKGVHSRDLLAREVQIQPDRTTIRARVYCTAAWSKYIKPKGLGGKTAFVEYLRKPLLKLRKPLTAELGSLIVREMQG